MSGRSPRSPREDGDRRDILGRRISRKASGPERERRRDFAADLRRQGASVAQIARALGVSSTSIDEDLRARGLTDKHRGAMSLPVDPAPRDWRTPIPTTIQDPRAYRHSVTLSIWASLARESREQHHVNKLAHDADDAEAAGDQVWLAEAGSALSAVIAEATRLRQVLLDRDARLRGRREEADDVGDPVLRVVRR